MASRPQPQGRPSAGLRSSARQDTALNNVASSPGSPKAAHPPAKKWPLVGAPATATSKPVVEKKTVSAFQSARAMFEAKKTPDTPAATPPPPPVRRRLNFPVPTAPPVVKQHPASCDLSASSCSTVDSESDRKLEERGIEKHEPKLSPVQAVVKTMEWESVAATGPKRNSAPPPMEPALRPPTLVTQASHSSSAAVMAEQLNQRQRQPDQAAIDPFRLLLPVEAMPTLPDEVPRVYDTAAIEMQKSIKKVARKLLKKNKAQLEEFKVNSRLFGTDFMDSHAYLDTLIKDFGAMRALQLIPSLLSIQPDILKSNALLLTAKNYLLQHEEALARDLQKMNARVIAQAGVHSTSSLNDAVEVNPPQPVITATPSFEAMKDENRADVDSAVDASSPAVIDIAVLKDLSPAPQKVLPEVDIASGADVAQKESATAIEAAIQAAKPVEPVPEPQIAGQPVAPPPVIDIVVAAPVQTSVTTTPAEKIRTTPPAKEQAESDTPSDSEDEFRAENLFGETIDPVPENKQQRQRQSNVAELSAVAPPSPASSTQSFDEAESLFGERLSSSSRSSTGRRKTVTWGDTQTVEAPVSPSTPVKTAKKPAPLIFGLATAAAFDSDSVESDFSD